MDKEDTDKNIQLPEYVTYIHAYMRQKMAEFLAKKKACKHKKPN